MDRYTLLTLSRGRPIHVSLNRNATCKSLNFLGFSLQQLRLSSTWMSNNNNLVPRVYQQEAAREALQGNKLVPTLSPIFQLEEQHTQYDSLDERNRIIRSDTGTGKTLIAILLIKHFSSIPPTPPSHEPKFIVFISPNVTLVIRTHNPLNRMTRVADSRLIEQNKLHRSKMQRV